jgi:hypothetical protein
MEPDYRKERWEGYLKYHALMCRTGDCDPAYPMVMWLAKRFALDTEQRYWLAFLYSCCYCLPTAWAMFTAFPSYQECTEEAFARYWQYNKPTLLFETDRAKVKNFDAILPMLASYRKIVGTSQDGFYRRAAWSGSVMGMYDPYVAYERVYAACSQFYYFGRFSLFLLLEVVNLLTQLSILPKTMDLRLAESPRNGLCYALGKDDWVTLHSRLPYRKIDYNYLQEKLLELPDAVAKAYPDVPNTIWRIETSLCGYKKLWWESRYLGFYIDRAQVELATVAARYAEMDWQPAWDFRRRYHPQAFLGEMSGWFGVRKEKLSLFATTGKFCLDEPIPLYRETL